MAEVRTDAERVLKLIERTRLLIAVDDEIPTETKLNVQPMLKMLEAAITTDDPSDHERASKYYGSLYAELQPYADIEALLSAMRVFLPFL
ncbi:MAG: hypothetical protein ACHQ9S_03510 [Candidatus Binatia bacterium]